MMFLTFEILLVFFVKLQCHVDGNDIDYFRYIELLFSISKLMSSVGHLNMSGLGFSTNRKLRYCKNGAT